MKFVDEQGEGASPTLAALRAYREHRAAARRGLPPDVSIDFAPPALQPLIRHNGETDRRRWESALFLKVRDEIQTGNLAIEGAKNFGRFEAFFLPTAQWEQVRDAFWARTGFPVDPDAAVEQLKARLSDAFDRFLDGVADNRQVTFDDHGWRLKTDPAEPPDPAQSDRLAELHRWLDARNRTIRLADLLIEVENDLGFSVHFQQPAERVDPGEVCALLAAIPSPTAATSASTPWRRSPPTLAAIVHGISRLDAAGHWGDGTTSASDGQRFAMPQKVLQRTYSTRFNDFALEFYSFVADNTTPRSTAVRSSAPTATHPSCSTACSTTRATSTSKSTTPTRTATPRSTSPRSAWSACGSALESAASTASGSIVPTRPATTASSSRSSSAAVGR